MGEFWRKCCKNFCGCCERVFLDRIANIGLVLAALLLLIALLVQPTVLVALALFVMFLWAMLYC